MAEGYSFGNSGEKATS